MTDADLLAVGRRVLDGADDRAFVFRLLIEHTRDRRGHRLLLRAMRNDGTLLGLTRQRYGTSALARPDRLDAYVDDLVRLGLVAYLGEPGPFWRHLYVRPDLSRALGLTEAMHIAYVSPTTFPPYLQEMR